jgi:hypothetical protein
VRFEEHRRHPGNPGGIAHLSLDLRNGKRGNPRVTDLTARTAVPDRDVVVGVSLLVHICQRRSKPNRESRQVRRFARCLAVMELDSDDGVRSEGGGLLA